MKQSRIFSKTNKSAKELDSKNATLLQKAGYIDQVMAGVYTFLPLGLRVLNKIEDIIRKEMDKIGTEVLMPAISPKQLWEQTERYETVDVLFKASGANEPSKRRNDTEYVLNPSHEEIITPLVQKFSLSYKDLPTAAYQIQSKFRNEVRPKSGIMRGREFRMKDLYSFHASEEDFLRYYHKEAIPAYIRVFERLGLGDRTIISLASGGDFTEEFSHEFQTKCDTGEDDIFYAQKANIYYNKEVAPSQAPETKQDTGQKDLEEVEGKGIIGVSELAKYLKIPVEQTTKTLIYEADDKRIIAAAVRGDYDINEDKLRKIVKTASLILASEKTVKTVTGAEIGYAGILNLPDNVEVFLDDSLKGRVNFECGANRTNYHSINVNFGRDIEEPDAFYDFKEAKEGDIHPETGEVYKVFRASEVGNIFPLKNKFSNSFNYTYTAEDGSQKPVHMGCYGIGSSRIMGVIAEIFNDEDGLVWPKSVAPFQVHLLNLKKDDTAQADKIYDSLQKDGFEVLYDDRSVRPGEKFADSDLIGIPVRLVISDKTDGKIEYKLRNSKETSLMDYTELLARLRD